MNNTKPMPTIGISNYTYFPITNEAANGQLTYGNAVSVPGLVQISPTDNGGTATFDADNGAYANVSYIETIGHEITNADIPAEVDAQWRGLTLNADGILDVGEPKTPYFGVAWKIEKANGKFRWSRYYKGSYSFASNVGGQTKPSSGAPEFQTATATYTAVKRADNGKYYSYIDEENLPEGITATDVDAGWFTSMDYSPTVVTLPENGSDVNPI